MAMPATFGIGGGVFAPTHRDDYYNIQTERYNAARAEAARVAGTKGIQTKVAFLKPVMMGAGFTSLRYQLPTGLTTKTLKENTAIFPWGILNLDACFDYIKWWKGASTDYIGDWFTLPIYYFLEHQGAWKGNVKGYEFRGGETFAFNVHCTTSPLPGMVDAWLFAWAVMPQTMDEVMITTA